MAKKFTFILGGARSGKSSFAQSLAGRLGRNVVFVATGEPLDEEMALRIKEHKRVRPESWHTLEVRSGVGQKLTGQIENADVVLLDCITLLVSNVLTPFYQCGAFQEELGVSKTGSTLYHQVPDEATLPLVRTDADEQVSSEIEDLIECIATYKGHFIAVSNEVGLGLVPEKRLARVYRDLLGNANQLLAQHADEVYFMVSGIPTKVKG